MGVWNPISISCSLTRAWKSKKGLGVHGPAGWQRHNRTLSCFDDPRDWSRLRIQVTFGVRGRKCRLQSTGPKLLGGARRRAGHVPASHQAPWQRQGGARGTMEKEFKSDGLAPPGMFIPICLDLSFSPHPPSSLVRTSTIFLPRHSVSRLTEPFHFLSTPFVRLT